MVAELIQHVEPGPAVRKVEAARIETARRLNLSPERLKERQRQRTTEQLVYFGAKAIVQEKLASNQRAFEIHPRGPNHPDKKIRLCPGYTIVVPRGMQLPDSRPEPDEPDESEED